MAWETALDRLVLQQIHAAEKGERRADDVCQQIRDLFELAPSRPETAFHLGYARVVLGADLPEPTAGDSSQRWYLFGRVRGHDRRGERNWIADLLSDQRCVMDLLADPRIAAQSLPVVMRTMFWCGDLDQAVRAVEFLASHVDDPDNAVLVDAALADVVSRFEVDGGRVDDGHSSIAILRRCIGLDAFRRLPADVQLRYYRALGARLLQVSAFSDALAALHTALDQPGVEPKLRSSVAVLAALATMRLHDIDELEPWGERGEREEVLGYLEPFRAHLDCCAPDAVFVLGVLDYERGHYPEAAAMFDAAMAGYRRAGEDEQRRIDRSAFFVAASLLAGGDRESTSRALRLMSAALDSVRPDLESFYTVHENLKTHDRRLALRFLDAVDVGRGTSPDQLLLVALEYLALGEATAAQSAAERVLQVTVDLDQRIEAMRVLLTAHNMRGDRARAQEVFEQIRDLLMQRGAFLELERLLKNEEFVGQALDHVDIKCELVALYEEMEDRDYEKAALQTQVARSLRARKDVESLRQAHGLLREVEIAFPELARDDLQAIEKLLALADADPSEPDDAPAAVRVLTDRLGRRPRVLVVGGNERQRRHHPRFDALAEQWSFDGEWLMANYSSPHKLVGEIGDRLRGGVDVLLLLHWNRHETTEPALELARKHAVPARTVHYAGFTSLQVSLGDQFERLATPLEGAKGGKGR